MIKHHFQNSNVKGRLFLKIKKKVAIVKLPIISLSDITHNGGIVSKDTLSAANAEPHITIRRDRRIKGKILGKNFFMVISKYRIWNSIYSLNRLTKINKIHNNK